MKKDLLINNILGTYMQEQGFRLITDKKTYWEWTKKIFGVEEKVTIYDEEKHIQLFFGNGIGKRGYVYDRDLFHTVGKTHTKIEQWDYYNYKGDLQELYVNILKDILDIIIVNWKAVLEKLAIECKEHVPNNKHFMIYKDNYGSLAAKFLKKYSIENEKVDIVFEIAMNQISLLFGKELEEVEDTLIGLAAMLEKVVMEQFGGNRKVCEEDSAIIVTGIGKQKQIFNFLLLIFHIWENPLYFEENKEDFLSWYKREMSL